MKRIILSGGGTGGHIYPAVAVAEALKRRFGDGVEILFVGAEGKMEMEKVPALGYRIVGSADRGPSAAAGLAQPGGAVQGGEEHPDGEEDHPRLRGRRRGGLRRLCQRSGAVGRAADGRADCDSGAELLCGRDE